MAILISIALGLLLARVYYYSGLFYGAMTLVAVVLAAAAGVGFGPVVSDLLEFDSPYRHAAMIFGVGAVGFGIIRVVLSPIDIEVDFPTWVERIGGGLAGLGAGVVLGGFCSLCLLSLEVPMLDSFAANMRSASTLALAPSRQIARLIPGQYPLDIDTVLSGDPPPPPPPVIEPHPLDDSPGLTPGDTDG